VRWKAQYIETETKTDGERLRVRDGLAFYGDKRSGEM